MKNYKLLFRVNPPSYFGLPEGEKIVVPSTGQKTIESPTIDPFTGNVTGHGTVSQYRPDTHPIHLDLQLSKATLKVRDNYFELALEADGSNSAVQIAEVAMQRLIRHLVAQQGDLFTFELVQGVDVAAKAPIHQPRMVDLVRATWYKLDDLEGYIRCAAE